MKYTAIKRVISLCLCLLMAISMLAVGAGAAGEPTAAADLLSGALMELPAAEELPVLEAAPVEEVPAEEISAEEAPVEEAPAEETPAEDGTSGTCGEGITWTLEGGVLTVSGTGAMADANYSGASVFYPHRASVTSLVVEEGVTHIGNCLFGEFTALTEVSLPATLETIGNYAFDNCSALGEITLPAGVKTVGNQAFGHCEGLTSVTLNAGLESVGDYAFTWCDSLTEIALPSSLASLGERTFYYCTALKTVTIPEDTALTSIAAGAFISCRKLESITLPAGIKTVEEEAFYGCDRLNTVVIKGAKTICSGAFGYAVYTLTIPTTLRTIEENALPCPNLRTLNYVNADGTPGTAEQFLAMDIGPGNDGLWEMMGLCPTGSGTLDCGMEWVMEDHVLTITGTGAMDDFSYSNPWADYKGFIEEVIVGEGITTLGDFALYDLGSVTKVTLPSTLTAIGQSAFFYCYVLKTVDFSGNDIYDLTVESGNDQLWEFLGKCPKASGTLSGGIAWSLEDFVLTVSGTGAIPDYEQWAYGDTAAPWKAYESFIQELVIGDGITAIGTYTFDSLYSLTTVTIPASVTAIGQGAFEYCSSIKTASFLGTADEWYALNENIGTGNDNLISAIQFDTRVRGVCGEKLTWVLEEDSEQGTLTLTIEGTGPMYKWNNIPTPWETYKADITDVVLPEGLTTIGDMAFYGMGKIDELTIPDTVTDIQYFSVADCRNLPTVEIPEAVETIGNGAFDGYLQSVYVYSKDVEIYPHVDTLSNPPYTVIYGYMDTTAQTYAQTYGYKFEPLDYTEGILASGTCGEAATWSVEDNILYIRGEGDMDDYTTEEYAPWYSYRGRITGVVVEEEVTSVGAYALYNMTNVRTATVEAPVTVIGAGAFYGCSQLRVVTFPEELKTVGDRAFYNCSRLQSVDLPDGCGTIGSYAFYNCWRIGQAELGGAAEIGDYAFYNCYNIPSLVLPDGLKTIGAHAFRDCKGLAKITLPASLESIGSGAFYAPTMTVVIENENLRQLAEEVGYDGSSVEYWYEVCYIYREMYGISDEELEELLNNPPEVVAGTDLTQVHVSGTGCVFPADENALGVPGCTVIYGAAGSTAEEYADAYGYEFNPEFVWSDVTGNGVMTTADAAEILKFATGGPSVFGTGNADTEALREAAADVNSDDAIDTRDATQILRYANGLPSKLG